MTSCWRRLRRWVVDEGTDSKYATPSIQEALQWRLLTPAVPAQDNSNDCGVFALQVPTYSPTSCDRLCFLQFMCVS